MKNVSKEVLLSSRPNLSAKEAVDYCLERLFCELNKTTADYLADKLTYEELIGALLLSSDFIYARRNDCDECAKQKEIAANKTRLFEINCAMFLMLILRERGPDHEKAEQIAADAYRMAQIAEQLSNLYKHSDLV